MLKPKPAWIVNFKVYKIEANRFQTADLLGFFVGPTKIIESYYSGIMYHCLATPSWGPHKDHPGHSW